MLPPHPGSGFQSRIKVAGAIAVLGLGYTLAAHVPLEQVRSTRIRASGNSAISTSMQVLVFWGLIHQGLKPETPCRSKGTQSPLCRQQCFAK